jgi:glycosyltransferase involved in cell wall biosynthesis
MVFPGHSPVVSVIVVSHNEGAWLGKTVNSLAATIPVAGETLVIDDNSTDGSVDRLLPQSRVRILRPKRRLGAARARNFGAQRAGGHILVFCDAHIEPPQRWFPPFRAALARPNVGLVGPACTEMNSREVKGFGLGFVDAGLNCNWLDQLSSSPYEVPLLGGFFLGIRRELFFEIGGFDPGFGIWGMEDVELVMHLDRRLSMHAPTCVSRSPGCQSPILKRVHIRNINRMGVDGSTAAPPCCFGELRLRHVFRFTQRIRASLRASRFGRE